MGTRHTLEQHLRAFGHLAAVHHEAEVEVHLPLRGLIDFATEAARVEKELSKIDNELAGIDKRLSNEGFVARAPREVVEKDRARAQELRGKREKMARHLARITSPEASMEERKDEAKPGEAAAPAQAHPTGEGAHTAHPGHGAGVAGAAHPHPHAQGHEAGAEKLEGAPPQAPMGGEGGADEGRGEPFPSHGQDRSAGQMGTHGGPEHHQAHHDAPAAPVHANGHDKKQAEAPAAAKATKAPAAKAKPMAKPAAKPAAKKAKPAAKAKAKAKPAAKKAKAKAKPAAKKAKAKAKPAAKKAKAKAKPAAKKAKAKAKKGKGRR
jgi:valyl-tRNA synthetase